TDSNYEFPIRNDVELSQTVKDFGTFKEDQIPVSQIAEKVKEAFIIFNFFKSDISSIFRA
ncbi:hypothetical protein VWM73_11010, partial [Campylobacter coli]